MKRLRGIWSEGTFAALKREYNLNRAKKRGIHRIHEECLLSALALNLKRIAKAMNRLKISSNLPDFFIVFLVNRAANVRISYFGLVA